MKDIVVGICQAFVYIGFLVAAGSMLHGLHNSEPRREDKIEWQIWQLKWMVCLLSIHFASLVFVMSV